MLQVLLILLADRAAALAAEVVVVEQFQKVIAALLGVAAVAEYFPEQVEQVA
jgi:hypothetical protein